MRSSKKTQAGRVWYAWTGVGKGMLLVLRLVSARGEQERRTMEGSRSESEGLVSLQFQNQSVQCHRPASRQVWWHMMGRDLGRGRRAGPGPPTNGVLWLA